MTRNSKPLGVLDKEYAIGRQTKKSWQYRVMRRTHEIIRAIRRHHPSEINSILDIGAAEGLMLISIKKEFSQAKCIGLEYSQELIDINQNKSIKIIQGDAQNLPFKNDSFDVAIATAVIEHVSQPSQMITEAHRILKENGILIITTPDPFFDKVSDLISIEESSHQETFNLKKLNDYFEKANFKVLKAEKFMLSPIGFPAELKIEKLLKALKLNFLLLNQIIVGKK